MNRLLVSQDSPDSRSKPFRAVDPDNLHVVRNTRSVHSTTRISAVVDVHELVSRTGLRPATVARFRYPSALRFTRELAPGA